MRKKLTGLILMGLALVAGSGVASAKLYANARFGYFIEIPAAFFVANPEPENGDGREFHPTDKSPDLIASLRWNTADNFDAEVGLYKSSVVQDGWKLTYEAKLSKSPAVYTGEKAKRIFYAHQITSCMRRWYTGCAG